MYDYLVDFYFRAKEEPEQKKEVVPVKTSIAPIPDEFPVVDVKCDEESQDAINTFKVLLQIADNHGLNVKSLNLAVTESRLHGNRIAVRKGMPLEAVNYELAFEIFHFMVNHDKGNMIDTPLRKYYNSQAERAATLMIELLNAKTA